MPLPNGNPQEVGTQLQAYLTSKHLPPSQQWLSSLLPSLNLTIPIAATQKTALFRLLATDITSSLQVSSTSCFPSNVASPAVKDLRLPGPITVQVLDIEDVGRSAWSQVETIEMEERGEFRKGSEIIRVADEDDENGTINPPRPGPGAASGPHKLLLQDAKATKVYAFEVESVEGIGPGMAIGAKLVLKGVEVARGVVLMSDGTVEVLGGKVESWEKKWREERKGRLKVKASGVAKGG